MKFYRLSLIVLLSSLIYHLSSNPISAATIADHTVISQFPALTQAQIITATTYPTLFMHQSTGNNVDYFGLRCLAGISWDTNYGLAPECINYKNTRDSGGWFWFDKSNLSWDIWPQPMSDGRAKTDQFVSIVHQRQASYSVLGMKHCYVDAWNQDFNYYRSQMEQLQSDYPTKTFIWTTQVITADISANCINGTWYNSCDSIQSFNNQLRSYAATYDIYLYDMADIESDGGRCFQNGKWGNDGTGTNVQYEVMCPEYYDGPGGGGGGHPDTEGGLVLAKGFWWLMANIDANSGPTVTPTGNPPPPASPTQIPIDTDLDNDDDTDFLDLLNLIFSFNTSGPGNFNRIGLVDIFDFNLLIQNL